MLLKQHMLSTIKLAGPIVVIQVGHIVTAIVDNVFLGQIGKTEQAAGFIANSVFVLLLVFCIGMSYSVTPLVTEAHVRNDNKEKAIFLKNSLVLNLLIASFLGIILCCSSEVLYHLDQPKDVVKMAIPFFFVITFSIIPCSLFFWGKQFSEGIQNTRLAMYISVAGNVLNIVLNFLLIHGYAGLPELGYMGSCWATFVSRTFMGLVFMVVLFKGSVFKDVQPFLREAKIQTVHLIRLWKIGIGSALQFTFEVAAFAIASIMSGWFGKESIDAHGISMNLAAFTYMFGNGISGAATIRVSGFMAKQDYVNLRRAGNSALILAIAIMAILGLVFIVFSKQLPSFFNKDTEVIYLASELLIIAAVFQLSDGIQVTSLGILRGMEDVKVPTIITFIAYWIVALPLCYLLAYHFNLQLKGIWLGLCSGLICVSVGLFLRYRYKVKKLNKILPLRVN